MNTDPIRYIREIGETSLAVPSDGASHSGQRRVKEQVSTMTRSKHKHSVRGSAGTISPTSPKSDSVFYESKYSPINPVNGSAFTYDSSMANGTDKMKQQKQSVMQRSVSTKSASYQRNQSNSMLPNSLPSLNHLSIQPEVYVTPSFSNAALSSAQHKQAKTVDRRYSHRLPNSPNQMITANTIQKTSNSSQFSGGQINSQFSGGQINSQFSGGQINSQFSGGQINSRQPISPQSNIELRSSVISGGKMDMNGLNGEAYSADYLVLPEAVNCLTYSDENYQLRGVSSIQHHTFVADNAKAEVRRLKAIGPLISLLNSPNPQIQEVTASALRNIVFKDSANKEEVRLKGGVNEALKLLQNTDSPDIQKHVTGLLWNLSSAESIRPELLRDALPVLTEKILKPNNCENLWISTDTNTNTESFYHATGCLRNLSSGKLPQNRRALRNCNGLIDSLVTYVNACDNQEFSDSKSLENCVCVLHNLTYQLDTEEPIMFSKLSSLAKSSESQNNPPDTRPIGCFSNQSRKVQQERIINYPLMDSIDPKGKDHLIQSDTLRSYLNLLSRSQNTCIQEACSGILHNLTAKKGILSDVMSHTIVHKLNGAQSLRPVLQSENATLKNAGIKLLGNMSRTPSLQNILARQFLPDVVSLLRPGSPYAVGISPDNDSAIALACQVTNNLLRGNPDVGQGLLNHNLINTLNDISLNTSLPTASKAAGVLLHNLWSDKTIQPVLKKIGMAKKLFVNDTTAAALRSVQVVD